MALKIQLNRYALGFTLLEVMVAIAIFSIFSVMAYSGIRNVLNMDKTLEIQTEELKVLRRSFLLIEKDFRQLIKRPRRIGFTAEELEPALTSGLGGEGIIEFSRSGNSNPAEKNRSNLQRIRYELNEGKLYRLSWNYIDHLDQEPVKIPLLSGVEEFAMRFFSESASWQNNWGAPNQITELPKAIEVVIKHEKWGEIKRVFPILIQ